MSKVLKFSIRIIITFVILFIILFALNTIFKIKQTLNNSSMVNESGGGEIWNWTLECEALNIMRLEKYHKHDTENFPIIMNKNEEIPKKANDEKRILVVGDSYVWNYSGTNINYSWWKQLNLKLKENGYANVNVYAAGFWGYNTEDQLNNILNNNTLINKIDPDLIIMGYVYNDPEQRDANNQNIIKDSWQPKNILGELFPNLNKELNSRLWYMTDNYNILKFVGSIFGYRYDIRTKLISEGNSAKNYKQVLAEVDYKLKELNIPYFYYYNIVDETKYISAANKNIYNIMNDLSLNVYYNQLPKDLYNLNQKNWKINPADYHPGIILTNYYGNDVYNILKKDYKWLFSDNKNYNLSLNINDTMPYIDLYKITDSKYEFKYPKKEKHKTKTTNFLYYPIRKNYIKLNLEYPKYVKRLKITSKKSDNIKDMSIYVNTIDKTFGYDFNESRQILTPCNHTSNNIYDVNDVITSVNISAIFKDDNNRSLRIEFIEE